MSAYRFDVSIFKGNDEFWENLTGNGIEEIQQLLNDVLEVTFGGSDNIVVELISYTKGD